MSEKSELFEASFQFTQDADCCDEQDCQDLHVQVCNGGGGQFFRIKTEGWAFNDIDELVACLQRVKSAMGEDWNA